MKIFEVSEEKEERRQKEQIIVSAAFKTSSGMEGQGIFASIKPSYTRGGRGRETFQAQREKENKEKCGFSREKSSGVKTNKVLKF